MAWTFIEDPQTLEGTSIFDTTHKFQAWLDANGRAELQGSALTNLARHYAPRYRYFMHVDEESLESVVEEEKARDEFAGYFCRIVFPSSVLIREKARAEGEIPDPQDPLDEQLELLDCVKKVSLESSFRYTGLLSTPVLGTIFGSMSTTSTLGLPPISKLISVFG